MQPPQSLRHNMTLLLSRALRLSQTPCLAFVGAGGKTSALFYLANELLVVQKAAGVISPRVIVSTTTHLAQHQASMADIHRIIKGPDDLGFLDSLTSATEITSGSILLTGAMVESERLSGLDEPSLDALHNLAQARQVPLLIEADGSRLRPLKAPAAHEPEIPAWVSDVVVVAGLSGVGRLLSADWVHRPEVFSSLSGLTLGETITPEALERLLVDPRGGLKNIPPAANRFVLLNQADTDEQRALAYRMAEPLLHGYRAVLVTSFSVGRPRAGRSAGGQAVDPADEFLNQPASPVFAVHEHVAGIVLAAGESSRLGQPKQLLDWKGEPFVRGAARKAVAAGLSPVVVVTGAYAGQVQDALADLPLEFAHNPDWKSGQASSVRVGLQAAQANAGAAIFLLSDQPFVTVELLRNLCELHAQTLAPLVAPLISDRRANPVLFDRATFPDLSSLHGDMGGRELFARYPVHWLPWLDERLARDIDTEEDYRRLLEEG